MPSIKKLLQAAAGNAGGTLGYVEDVFSTYLYEGTGTAQTITNGIDLDGEGGLVWAKSRTGTRNHILSDTERGTGRVLFSNLAAVEDIDGTTITSYNSDGFSMGSSTLKMNTNGEDFASWTFRKAEKFFDVVTYTGTGSARTVAHNLGSVPGMIIVKGTDIAENWIVYHRSLGATHYIQLNTISAAGASSIAWNNTEPTSTEFTVNTFNAVNEFGYSYVAYVFAHDAGGFGDGGDENIIKCGSYTGTGSAGLDVDLGFEPQWIFIKDTSGGHSAIYDVMRQKYLAADLSNAESAFWAYPSPPIMPRATGITIDDTNVSVNDSGEDYIYMAIRRPMKTPESGTEVFDPAQGGASVANNALVTTTNFPVDMFMNFDNYTSGGANFVVDRLRGRSAQLRTQYTAAEEFYSTNNPSLDSNEGLINRSGSTQNKSGAFYWSFKRATGFFDVVAYTGDSVAGRTVSHNLGVAPELMVVKARSDASASWSVYSEPLGNTKFLRLNSTNASSTSSSMWNNTSPTADVFTLGTDGDVNWSGSPNYIAYLFATLAGVSKVGSYTGTAADLNVDCGFSAGARFILIKRTDSTGDWYVWDSARGIVAGNDPYLLLNSLAAEVTSTDYIDPLSSGFTVTSSAPAALNASGGTYIFLAIA